MAQSTSHRVILWMGLGLIVAGLLLGVFTALAIFVPIIVVLLGLIGIVVFAMRHRAHSQSGPVERRGRP